MASKEDFVGTTVKYYGRQEVDDEGNMTRCILVSIYYNSYYKTRLLKQESLLFSHFIFLEY